MTNVKKNKILFFFLAVAGLVIGCSAAVEDQGYQDIDAIQAAGLIKQEPVLILDVRTPEEYREGHIKGSVLIPVQELDREYTKISNHLQTPVLVYCRSGNRSVTASKILVSKGFRCLYHMKGGIKDWIRHGLPLEKSP
nr:rhodanese-like domain-containing protein [Desulfobacula sp.]